jgi:MFS family permease
MEHGSDAQRGRNAAFAQMGPGLGVLLASATVALISALLTPEELLAWGWRLPLLASLVLVAFGLWIRFGVPESPQFRALEESGQQRAPLGEVLRGHWRGLLIAGGSRFGPDVQYSLMSAFLLTYISTILGFSRTLATTALAVAAAFNVVCVLLAGHLSDRYGRRLVYGVGVAATVLWLWALFPMLDSRSEPLIVTAVAIGGILHAIMWGPQAAFIAEQFPTRVRYAGASLAFTLAGVFAGGLAPLAFTALYRAWETPVVIVWYTIGALFITTLALRMARKRPEG